MTNNKSKDLEHRVKVAKKVRIPNIGDEIYVPSALHMSHGIDDFAGGLAHVSGVEMGRSAGEMVPFISISERPGYQYNLRLLQEDQAHLRRVYKGMVAGPDPDYRPEFNDWA